MTTEPIAETIERYTALETHSALDTNTTQLAITIADHACEVLPKVREALEAAIDDLENEAWNIAADKVREALALIERGGK